MIEIKQISSALISVYDKTGLAPVVEFLHKNNVSIYSTGGTQSFIESMGISVIPVEDLTSFPSILGGRVKTLHPKVFGGILNRRELKEDQAQIQEYEIPEIDLVIVDLYPFEATVASGASHEAIIEKIDIGGISLIRAAAKNYNDVVILSAQKQYQQFLDIVQNQNGSTTIGQRLEFATSAFQVSAHYDAQISRYLTGLFKNENITKIEETDEFPTEIKGPINSLRYGENPHQKGDFFGDLEAMFTKISGKELSYNNLLDIDAAVNLMNEFKDDNPTFAILKHNNPCGLAVRKTIEEAYDAALESDPVSAFGGILIANSAINHACALKLNDLFFEVLIAPKIDDEALQLLTSKKNRILLIQHEVQLPTFQIRTALNGFLKQEKDLVTEKASDLAIKTFVSPSEEQIEDLLFANKIVKHVKSNTIVLAKNAQLLSCGTGQTSRVDALNQAIDKAKRFGFDLTGAVMSSDAFFPFPDCVEIADEAGIKAVIQPGGSIKDELSIEYCNQHKMSMVFTGVRHFKH